MTAADHRPMSLWKRFVYAFFCGVVAVGVGTVTEMFLAGAGSSLRIGDFIFSPLFFVPVVVASYCAAPWLARRFHFD
jgi:Zn-dependent protease with chaperone function